jgi:hypothetical protein
VVSSVVTARNCGAGRRGHVEHWTGTHSHTAQEVFFETRSRVSSGSIVSDYGLDDRAIEVRFPAGAKDFSSNPCVQTGSGAHPASCTMGSGGPFPGGKSAAGA